jgi:carbonic anhydrase
MSTSNWSFSDTSNWGGLCNAGVSQSPINIDTELTIQCESLCELKIYYKPSSCKVKFNNGMIKLIVDTGSYIVYKNVVYNLEYMTVHTPTMHKIDGEKYDMEIILVHSAGNPNEGGITISCLYAEGPHYGSTETFFNQFINDTPAFNLEFEEDVPVSDTWGANMLLPEQRSFFVYEGSLMYPPCTTSYTNIVLEHTGTIGTTNLAILKKYLKNNIRSVQSLNNRTVFYSVGKDILPSERKVEVKDDRFLRCVKKKDLTTTASPSIPNPTNYVGCYTDTIAKKVLNLNYGFVKNLDDCNKAANKQKTKIFGLYESKTIAKGGSTAKEYKCMLASPNDDYTNFDVSTNCNIDEHDKITYGDTSSVAIYKSTGEYSFFTPTYKKYIKSISLLICIALILANSYYITKYAFKHGVAQKIFIGFVGLGALEKIGQRPTQVIQAWNDTDRCRVIPVNPFNRSTTTTTSASSTKAPILGLRK